MKVVSNTTPIISLASIGQLSLLPELFGKIYIPQAVYYEIKSKKAYGYQVEILLILKSSIFREMIISVSY
jgi:predicted nucleic acid-binding protein